MIRQVRPAPVWRCPVGLGAGCDLVEFLGARTGCVGVASGLETAHWAFNSSRLGASCWCYLTPSLLLLQLRVLYHNVKVVVAPLLSGAGVKGKVRSYPAKHGNGALPLNLDRLQHHWPHQPLS
jgi:hypothetical protein